MEKPDFLGDLASLQRDLAMNDVDDVVLYAKTRKRVRVSPLRLEAFGKYRRMGEPSVFSRIFPERAAVPKRAWSPKRHRRTRRR